MHPGWALHHPDQPQITRAVTRKLRGANAPLFFAETRARMKFDAALTRCAFLHAVNELDQGARKRPRNAEGSKEPLRFCRCGAKYRMRVRDIGRSRSMIRSEANRKRGVENDQVSKCRFRRARQRN